MTTLLEDSTKAANQGKAGYDVFGNKLGMANAGSAGDAQVLANQQAAAKLGISIPGVGGAMNQSTTTLSSDKSKDISNIQNTTKNLSQTGVTTSMNQNGEPVSTYADGSVYQPGNDDEEYDGSSGGYLGETYIPAGAPVPEGAKLTQYSPTDKAILDGLAEQRTKNDAITAGIISNIQSQFAQYKRQQEETNRGAEAGVNKLLLRNGGLQHAGSGTNVLSSQISYGTSQLADLTNKEQMSILAAQQAGQNMDFQLMSQINKEIQSTRDKKIAIATKMNDDIAAANKKANEAKVQASRDSAVGDLLMQGVTDPNQMLQYLNYDEQGNQIGDYSAKEVRETLATLNPDKGAIQTLAQKLGENGADPELIQKVLKAGSLDNAIAMAGGSMQDPKLQLELQKLNLDTQLAKINIMKAQKEYSLLGEPTDAEKKENASKLKEASAAIPVMQDKIEAVDILKNAQGMNTRVGTSALSRGILAPAVAGAAGGALVGSAVPGIGTVAGGVTGLIAGGYGGIKDKVTGSGQEFAGGVHKLVNGLTIDNLIAAKARGATFGALSEGELALLASSATALNDWEVKDGKGQGTGYWNIDEKSFKKELDNIKMLTQRAITQSQGSAFSSDEKSLLDKVYEANEVVTPDMYFNN